MQFRSLIFSILLTLVVITSGCQGALAGIHIGVWGGSNSDGGIGVGINLPAWGSESSPAEILLPENLPFQIGEIVAENTWYYRRFLGLTPKGALVVQDYYQQYPSAVLPVPDTELKLTDAYVVLTLQSVTAALPTISVHDMNAMFASSDFAGDELSNSFPYHTLNIDGDLVVWYASGNKALTTHYQAGLLHGNWQQWYENTNLQVKGQYQFGERFGNWIFWNERGEIIRQYDYLRSDHP